MTRIDPTGLYSRADLAEMLKPLGLDVDSFIAKIRPARRFRLAFWGGDLIAAIEKTPTLPARVDDGAEKIAKEVGAPRRRPTTRRRKPRTQGTLSPLDAIIQEAKRQ